MLVCNVSTRPPRRAIAAELAEAALADDTSTTGQVVFATLVDDPASVLDTIDAYLGEIMLEMASAADSITAGLDYATSIAEVTTSADVPDGTVTGAPTGATWNPSDKSSTITLSGGNLTAGSTSAADGGVRSTKSISSGKAYFEVTWNTTIIGADGSCGIATPGAVLGSMGATALGIAAMYPSGTVWLNGSATSVSLVLPTAPFTICVAVDLTNSRIWFRANAGPWNQSGTADPATNTGGINIAALFPTNAAFAELTMSAIQASALIGNFGATAFAQSVPSGFVSWNSA
jgi:hypothetical protein